jgi:hypothetical protein
LKTGSEVYERGQHMTIKEVCTQFEIYDKALVKLNYKIDKYEEAVKTGILIWDHEQAK